MAKPIAQRLAAIFLRDGEGRRPVFGDTQKFQEDPHWRDYLLFNEYFHGDNGAGRGASHLTGWTGAVASCICSRLSGPRTSWNVARRHTLRQPRAGS